MSKTRSTGGISTNIDSGLTKDLRKHIGKKNDQADIMGEAVDKAVSYGPGMRVSSKSLTRPGKDAIQEDAAASLYTDRSSNDYDGDLVPIQYLDDEAAPGGVWLFWSAADERRILGGSHCGWCGAKQKHSWGSEPGRMASYLRGVSLHGDVTDPRHLAHEGGFCDPLRPGAEGCGNQLRDGIYYAKDIV